MKTKFSVEIHTIGNFNDSLIKMITNHNAGLVDLTLSTITGFVNGKYAEYPTITPITTIRTSYPNKTMDIFEGEGVLSKHTLTITLKELEELQPGVDEAPTVFLQNNNN